MFGFVNCSALEEIFLRITETDEDEEMKFIISKKQSNVSLSLSLSSHKLKTYR
jgi:hypothetical protein